MRDGDLEGSFLTVIGDAGGKDLVEDAAEFALDSVLKDEVLKDIPVVGVVAKMYSTAVAVQGYLFAKKVKKFLTEFRAIPLHEREAFANRTSKDKDLRDRLAEILLNILNKLDDSLKAPLLARAFAGYVREEFDFSTLQRLAAAVDRCFVSDLQLLESMSAPRALDGYVGDLLVSAGLANVVSIPAIRASDTKSTYIISHLGELFLQVVVKGLPRDDQ